MDSAGRLSDRGTVVERGNRLQAGDVVSFYTTVLPASVDEADYLLQRSVETHKPSLTTPGGVGPFEGAPGCGDATFQPGNMERPKTAVLLARVPQGAARAEMTVCSRAIGRIRVGLQWQESGSRTEFGRGGVIEVFGVSKASVAEARASLQLGQVRDDGGEYVRILSWFTSTSLACPMSRIKEGDLVSARLQFDMKANVFYADSVALISPLPYTREKGRIVTLKDGFGFIDPIARKDSRGTKKQKSLFFPYSECIAASAVTWRGQVTHPSSTLDAKVCIDLDGATKAFSDTELIDLYAAGERVVEQWKVGQEVEYDIEVEERASTGALTLLATRVYQLPTDRSDGAASIQLGNQLSTVISASATDNQLVACLPVAAAPYIPPQIFPLFHPAFPVNLMFTGANLSWDEFSASLASASPAAKISKSARADTEAALEPLWPTQGKKKPKFRGLISATDVRVRGEVVYFVQNFVQQESVMSATWIWRLFPAELAFLEVRP